MGLRSRMRRLRRNLIGDVRPVILNYHRVAELDLDPWALTITPKHFAQQMAHLRRHRTPMRMGDFVDCHRRGTLPRDAVAVTFDDGYLDNLTQAKPVLVAEDIPATLFVVTGEAQRGLPFWSDELTRLVLGHRGSMDEMMDIVGSPVRLRWSADDASEQGSGWLGWNPPTTPRQAAHVELWRRLRQLSEGDRAERMAWLRARLGPVDLDGDQAMTEAQLRSFCAGGLMELGGHTITHPTLPSLSREQRREELEGCREQLLIMGLGIAASLAEGIGIGLFLPLLQGLDGSQGGNNGMLGRITGDLFGSIPAEQRVNILLACIVAAIATKSALTFGYGALAQWLYARVTHQLRSATIKQLLAIAYPFIQRSRTGSLINTLSTATWQTGDATGTLINIIVTIATAAVYVGLLLLISWKLTLAVAVGMLVISMVGAALVRRGALLGRVLRRANASLAHRMLQSLNGMKVIRTFGREDYEQQRFEQASARVSKILFRVGLLTRAVEPIYELLVVTLLIVILAIGLRQPGTLPSLVVFIVLLYRLQPKIKQVDTARVTLSSAGAAVEDVTSLLDARGKSYARSGALPCARLRDSIRYDDVSFAYAESDPRALCDVSLRIAAGKTTALVGRSGSGKSTLISLLLRLYEPTSGEIYVDGVPLHLLDMAAWRSRIAVVSQDIYMFDASVRENIAYGRLDASDEEIVAAARLAHADEFIVQLPQGYHTPMGERGVRLSGGQQQRIALARAIIRDPDILILDEATNALDSISEQLIQEALDTLNQDRTVIVIAHRLSTVQRAHHVAVFSEGRIIEQGEPSRLLRGNGLFARLHHLQYQDALTQEARPCLR